MSNSLAIPSPLVDAVMWAKSPESWASAAPISFAGGSYWDTRFYPLVLSVFAGLSTSIGGGIAVLKKPDDSLLAVLLGLAMGVMATLSFVELYVLNMLRVGFVPITAFYGAGVLTYYGIHHFFPVIDSLPSPKDQGGQPGHPPVKTPRRDMSMPPEESSLRSQELEGSNNRLLSEARGTYSASSTAVVSTNGEAGHKRRSSLGRARFVSSAPSELWRLGMLMGVTMTLHNMPEGFAVAFSAFSDLGPVVAASIAMHNIPEGIIVAAPIFAATGSRWKAFWMAFASGMSEPLGAFLALTLAGPSVTAERLDYMLAYVGGIMMAVCTAELWPEARKCGNDSRMIQGIVVGAILIGITLYAGV